jgi:hypothetical protein
MFGFPGIERISTHQLLAQNVKVLTGTNQKELNNDRAFLYYFDLSLEFVFLSQ